jgi:carotenoid 1,2-hydratase
MTERGANAVDIAPTRFQVGPSALAWDGTALTIDIDERAAPLPLAIRGRIRLEPETVNSRAFAIDGIGRHIWRPIAPTARVAAEFDAPRIAWRGRGYLDWNSGAEPLERAFRSWDWSRSALSGNRTLVFYDCVTAAGEAVSQAVMLGPEGVADVAAPPARALPPTPIWRIARRMRGPARLVRTLEDTPFYSRSILETEWAEERAETVHESLIGRRLASPIVKAMLPFRMPRIAGAAREQ